MNHRLTSIVLLFFFLAALPGCSLVEGVFRLGIWFTILGFILVIVLLVLIFRTVSYKPENKTEISH